MKGFWPSRLHSLLVGLAILAETAKALTENAVLPGTFGRYFVFPVPLCNTSMKPYLLLRAETEGQLVEVTLSGLFVELIHTRMEDFSRFQLPCRLLKKRGVTQQGVAMPLVRVPTSSCNPMRDMISDIKLNTKYILYSTSIGAITLSTSRPVMAHVTYEEDNFLVYPVHAFGSRFIVSSLKIHPNLSADSVLHVAISAAYGSTQIFMNVQHPTQQIRNGQNIISSNVANVSLNENDVTVLEFPHTFTSFHIESSRCLFVLVWSTREGKLDFIEQLPPDFTWGTQYLLPVPAWISGQIQVSITAGDIVETHVDIRTKQWMKSFMMENESHLATEVAADGFVDVSSSRKVLVMFLVQCNGEENTTSTLIAGVALRQYIPVTCQFLVTHQSFTTIAYLQYGPWSMINVTDLFGNVSIFLNFTILEVVPARRISVPYLHEVLGAFSMYVHPHAFTYKLQLLTGANMNQHYPPLNTARLNITTTLNKTTFFNGSLSETFTQIHSFNENSEIFAHIGCHLVELQSKSNWFRGRLKSTGVTASVIAVIVSIVIAVFGVIGFIIGLVIIELTGKERQVRAIRIAPVVEDPSLHD